MSQPFQKRARTEQTVPSQKLQQLAAMQSLQNESRDRQRADLAERDEKKALSNASLMGSVTQSFIDAMKPPAGPPTVPVLSEGEKAAQNGRERTLTDKLKGVETISWVTDSGWFEGFEQDFVDKLRKSMISTKMLLSTFSQSSNVAAFAKQLGELTAQEINAIYSHFEEILQ